MNTTDDDRHHTASSSSMAMDGTTTTTGVNDAVEQSDDCNSSSNSNSKNNNNTAGSGELDGTCQSSQNSNNNNNNNNNNNYNDSNNSNTSHSPPQDKNILAFGSCNDPYQYNALWPIIQARQPTAFIWCGDAIYADKPPPPPKTTTLPRRTTTTTCATPGVFDVYYPQQRNVPGYRAMLSSSSAPHIFGTLDDHDYGCNNADRTYPFKYESGLAFLKFIQASPDSLQYQRGLRGEGIYGVQLYDFAAPHQGPARVIADADANIDADLERLHVTTTTTTNRNYTHSNQTVAVFVLDVRTHKTPWKTHWYERFFQKDLDGDFLGPQQIQWLQRSVERSNATIHVYVSGIQFHPYRYPDGNIAESWSQYPRAQQQLYNILLSTSKPSILISGDVHMTQLLQKDCLPYSTIVSPQSPPDQSRSSSPLPTRRLVEMTTSGMTHSWGTLAIPLTSMSSRESPHRHSYFDWYRSYISKLMLHLLHYTCPWTDIIAIPASNKVNDELTATTPKTGLQYSLEQNFGEIEIDFRQEQIRLRTIGTKAQPLLQVQYAFDELSLGRGTMSPPPQTPPHLSMKDYQNEVRNNPQLYGNISQDDPNQWVCINHRGRDTILPLVTGYMTSIAVLTILAPLPILVPPTLCILLVMRCWRRLGGRRRRRTCDDSNSVKSSKAVDSIRPQEASRVQYSPRITTTTTAAAANRPMVMPPPATRPKISTFWRFTWMSTVPESTNGKKSFFPSKKF